MLAVSIRPLLSSPFREKPPTMNQAKRTKRNEVRVRYRKGLRRAKAVSDYLLLAAPQHHLEATQFVLNLEQKYPDKHDITKTREFRQWEKKQLARFTINNNNNNNPIDISGNQIPSIEQPLQQKELTLRIPLIPMDTIFPDIPTASDTDTNAQDPPASDTDTNAQDPPASDILAEEEQIVNAFNEIPPHVMNDMIEEIRNDPVLNEIMNQLDVREEIIDEGDICDINLNIDFGSPLEDELNIMLQF